MNDEHVPHDPGVENDGSTTAASDAADRVRRTLAAAVPGDTHVAAGLEDLHRRLSGVTVVPLLSTAAHGGRRLRLLAAAAVLVLIVAGVVLVAVAKQDQGPEDVGASADSATGWYVPNQLPPGWEVNSITSVRQDVTGFGGTCPCRITTWGGKRKTLTQVTATAARGGGDGLVNEGRAIALGDGIDGVQGSDGVDFQSIHWIQDGQSIVLLSRNLSRPQLLAASRTLVKSGANDPPLDGFDRVDNVTAPGDVHSYQLVSVNLRNQNLKVDASYTIVTSGFGGADLTLLPQVVSIPGQRLPLLSLQSPEDSAHPDASIYFGRWPGADVTISSTCDYCGKLASSDPGVVTMANRDATDAQVQSIIASLRPADAATWKAFVHANPSDKDPNLAVNTIANLNTPGQADPGGD